MKTLTMFLLVLFLFSQNMAAKEKTLQNDDFTTNSGDKTPAISIVTGEGFAVKLTPDTGDFPLTIKRIQVLMVDNPLIPQNECGLFSLVVYHDNGNLNPVEPAIFDSSLIDLTFELPANNNVLFELDLTDPQLKISPIKIESGAFRIMFKAEGKECVANGGNNTGYPVMFVDNQITPGVNFIYGSAGSGRGNMWFAGESIGLKGDFVFRVIADVPGTATEDVVTPEPEPELEKDVNETIEQDTYVQNDVSKEIITPKPDVSETTQVEETNQEKETITQNDVQQQEKLTISSISPAIGYTSSDTDVVIVGANFQKGLTAKLDAKAIAIFKVEGQLIEARIPTTEMTIGVKTLIVQNPDGKVATLNNAFEVKADTSSSVDSGGCSINDYGSNVQILPFLLLILSLLALILLKKSALKKNQQI